MERRLNPTTLWLLGGLVVLLLLIIVLTGRNRSDQDRLGDDQLNQVTSADPEKRCSAQKTYDLIKRELFRRAAQIRGSDRAAFDQLVAYSSIRMDAPMLRSHDEDIGTISCSGTLALDLPPGVAVVGGRRTLTAEIGYSLQPAADGSGDVLTLANADSIITPLATLARVGASAEDPLAPIGNEVVTEPLEGIDVDASESAAKEVGPATVFPGRPSFDCGAASTRGELAVCGDTSLSALDVNMATQYRRAISAATPEQRALLERTRGRFLQFRDGCGSDSCIAEAYRGRMTEIRDIMEGRWRAPR